MFNQPPLLVIDKELRNWWLLCRESNTRQSSTSSKIGNTAGLLDTCFGCRNSYHISFNNFLNIHHHHDNFFLFFFSSRIRAPPSGSSLSSPPAAPERRASSRRVLYHWWWLKVLVRHDQSLFALKGKRKKSSSFVASRAQAITIRRQPIMHSSRQEWSRRGL